MFSKRFIEFVNTYTPYDPDCRNNSACELEANTNSGNCSFSTYKARVRDSSKLKRIMVKFPTQSTQDRLEREVIILDKLTKYLEDKDPYFSQQFMKLTSYFVAPGSARGSLHLKPVKSDIIYQCIAFEVIRKPLTLNDILEKIVENEIPDFLNMLNKFYKSILKLAQSTGFVHNDLHACNILVKDDYMLLIDYGRSYMDFESFELDSYKTICDELGKNTIFDPPKKECKLNILLNDEWVKIPRKKGGYDAILTDLGGLSLYMLAKRPDIFKKLNVGKVENNKWRKGEISKPRNNLESESTPYYYIMKSFYWMQTFQTILSGLDRDETLFAWKDLFSTDGFDDDTRSLMTTGGTVYPPIFNFALPLERYLYGGAAQLPQERYNINLVAEYQEIDLINDDIEWNLKIDDDSNQFFQRQRMDDILSKEDENDNSEWLKILRSKAYFDYRNLNQFKKFKASYEYYPKTPIINTYYDIKDIIQNNNSKKRREIINNANIPEYGIGFLRAGNSKTHIYFTDDPKHKARKIYILNGDKYVKKGKEKLYLKYFKGKYRYI